MTCRALTDANTEKPQDLNCSRREEKLNRNRISTSHICTIVYLSRIRYFNQTPRETMSLPSFSHINMILCSRRRGSAPLVKSATCCLAVGLILTISASSFASATPTRSAVPKAEGTDHRALNYLLFSSSTSRQAGEADERKLEELLKDANHSHVSDAVSLPLANSVWKRMHQNALEFAQQRAHEARPAINQLLVSANVSSTCYQSLNDVMEHLTQLDMWAVQSK